MSRKVKDLEWRCQLMEQRLDNLETKLGALSAVVERNLENLDDLIECHVNGKVRMMVVKNLEAYKKGKAIKPNDNIISATVLYIFL